MTGRALRSALGLWAREPKALVLLNLAWACLAYLGLGLGAKLLQASSGQGLLQVVAIALFLLVWLAFCWMLRAIAQIDRGQRLTRSSAKDWLKDAWAPRLIFGLAWIEISWVLGSTLLRGDLGGLPKIPLGLGFAAWLWGSLGALLGAGLDAPLEQPAWAAQKAGVMAAVAFLPTALGLALWTLFLAGPLALLSERAQWWSRILWIPLILSPFFTPSFYAAYLYYLAQGIKDQSQGRPPLEGAPSIKEILRPWR